MQKGFAENARSVMGIATERLSSDAGNKEISERERKIRSKIWAPFRTWLQGLFISIIPILCYPVYELVISKIGAGDFLAEALCSSEIIFLAISLCVSSLNDSTDIQHWRFFGLWNTFVWWFIILGACFFGLISIAEKSSKTINLDFVIPLNIVLFVVAFIAGSIPYIVSIVNGYKKLKEVKA